MSSEKVYVRLGVKKGLPNEGRHTRSITAICEIHSLGQEPYFSMTAETRWDGQVDSCGQLGEQIDEHFPQLAPFRKWHLVSVDQPMHYVANTLYHIECGKFDWAKTSCVYGALPQDSERPIESVDKQWLLDRLPVLMAKFRAEMRDLFENVLPAMGAEGYADGLRDLKLAG